MRCAWIVLLAVGCGDSPVVPTPPTASPAREVIDTKLVLDVTAHTGVATITFGKSAMPGASLETGGLVVSAVTSEGAPIMFGGTTQLDLGLPASDQPLTVEISYTWMNHEKFQGASVKGYTLIWPYYCSNLFPCHSQPSDGTTFTLELAGIPDGKTAIYPTAIPGEAPAYQIAWSIDAYTDTELGVTTNGTHVAVAYRPGISMETAKATAGTAHLVAAFDWLEQHLGAYTFGDHVGSVSVGWPLGAFGGMEHHPRWHVGSSAIGDENTNVHEAAHGWFGDGIRLQCWEDFVLSEGTVSYLAAHVLDVVAPAAGAASWTSYASDLNAIHGTDPVWPQSCGQIDVLTDNLFTRAPYMRGAFFYKGIADKVGADLLDQALATFYQAHKGGAARMADMLDTIKTVTGYDPAACAQIWLVDQTQTAAPTPGPCP